MTQVFSRLRDHWEVSWVLASHSLGGIMGPGIIGPGAYRTLTLTLYLTSASSQLLTFSWNISKALLTFQIHIGLRLGLGVGLPPRLYSPSSYVYFQLRILPATYTSHYTSSGSTDNNDKNSRNNTTMLKFKYGNNKKVGIKRLLDASGLQETNGAGGLLIVYLHDA